MVLAMFLAHLVGDYILQWDRLAYLKMRELKWVLIHGGIVLVVTVAFAVTVNPAWWPWALFIGLTHTLIDAVPLWLGKRLHLSIRFVLDQLAHTILILLALIASGYLNATSIWADILVALSGDRLMTYILGYAFITMPAWIVVEFFAYGLIRGSAPDFTQAPNKYVVSLERGLITTFVVLGQFILVPLVALPRLIFDRPQVMGSQGATLYVTEFLTSVLVAILIGLGLRFLQ